MGRSLMKNAYNLGLLEPLREAVDELGFKAADIFDMEPDAEGFIQVSHKAVGRGKRFVLAANGNTASTAIEVLQPQEYDKLIKDMAPKSPIVKDCFHAFWVGGSICTLGQLILNGYLSLGLEKTDAGTAMSITLVALSALLTGLSLYDNIAKFAGAGTLVPITGFANAVAAPAVEFKTEGFILGVGAKMFTIAGPVIVYGVSASVVYGLIYWISTLFL